MAKVTTCLPAILPIEVISPKESFTVAISASFTERPGASEISVCDSA